MLSFVLALVAVYLAAVAYLYLAQRSYVFVPSGELGSPAEHGLRRVETVTIEPEPGVTLTGWYSQAGEGQPTVLYFPGNAGNLSGRVERFERIQAAGFGFLSVSYRGYAGSGGAPSEAALFSDALKIFDWLAGRTGDIVIHGESLGTGIATYVAAERPARAVVLEAPYTAALDVAAETYPWAPVGWLMRDPFLTREHIKRVDEPVLIAHGTEDRVISVAHGRRLYEVAGDPKQLAIFEGAGHAELWDCGLWTTILDFLDRNAAAAPPPTGAAVQP